MLTIAGTLAFDSIRTPAGAHSKLLGGSGMYASVAASLFTAPYLISIIGHDFPEEYVSFLTDRKINLSGVTQSDGLTFHWSGAYEKDLSQAQTIATDLNVLWEFNPQVPEQALPSRVVLMANFDPVLQRKAILQFSGPKLVVMDTMNFWIENCIDELRETIGHADVLIINDQELRMLSGKNNLIQGIREVMNLGLKRIVVKKGEHGAIMFNGTDYFMCPALPVDELIDPTGAGDTFAGAFCGYLATHEGWTEESFRRAVLYGILVSSHTVRGFGINGINSLTKEDLEGVFATYRKWSALPETLRL
jgi:sugar/nucleoside kinase (ribokinase family)